MQRFVKSREEEILAEILNTIGIVAPIVYTLTTWFAQKYVIDCSFTSENTDFLIQSS